EIVPSSMEITGAGLDAHVNCGARGKADAGVVAGRLDLELLDHVRRWSEGNRSIASPGAAKTGCIGGAVQGHFVFVRTGTVNLERSGPAVVEHTAAPQPQVGSTRLRQPGRQFEDSHG